MRTAPRRISPESRCPRFAAPPSTLQAPSAVPASKHQNVRVSRCRPLAEAGLWEGGSADHGQPFPRLHHEARPPTNAAIPHDPHPEVGGRYLQAGEIPPAGGIRIMN